MSDSDVIDRLGGTTAVARLFCVKPHTVSGWRTRGIPPLYWLGFQKKCEAEGFAFQPDKARTLVHLRD